MIRSYPRSYIFFGFAYPVFQMFSCTSLDATGVLPFLLERLPHIRTSRPVPWMYLIMESEKLLKYSFPPFPWNSSVPICTVVSLSNTGSSPWKYCAHTDLAASSAPSFRMSSSSIRYLWFPPASLVIRFGNALVIARACAGISNSGMILTPMFLLSLMKERNSSFV